MVTRVVRWSELIRAPWANGLGTTREIARSPRDGDFAWRLSAADVPKAAAFSPLPGVERHLGVLAGGALDLTIDGEFFRIEIGDAPVRFDGAATTVGAPVAEPAIDLNLMTRAGTAVGTLDSVGAGQHPLSAGFTAVIALVPGITVRIGGETYELGALDALLRESDADGAAPFTIEPAIEAAVESAIAPGPVAYLARVGR